MTADRCHTPLDVALTASKVGVKGKADEKRQEVTWPSSAPAPAPPQAGTGVPAGLCPPLRGHRGWGGISAPSPRQWWVSAPWGALSMALWGYTAPSSGTQPGGDMVPAELHPQKSRRGAGGGLGRPSTSTMHQERARPTAGRAGPGL